MSTNIKLKRSSVQGKVPLATDLELGELAINTYDGKLYMKKNDGTDSIVDITAASSPNLDSVTTAGNTTTNDITVGNINLPDNGKATFGAGSDLQIYHNGSNSFIEDVAGTGSLYIRSNQTVFTNPSGTENVAVFNEDADVRLFYNGAIKLATTATGIDVTGTVTATSGVIPIVYGGSGASQTFTLQNTSGNANNTKILIGNVVSSDNGGISLFSAGASTSTLRMRVSGTSGDISFYEDTGTTAQLVWDASADALTFGDNVKATFGAGSDLQIYHSGADSIILDNGTGNLEIRADNLSLLNAAGSEYYARFYTNGAANLYHDGNLKLNTISTGIDVTGTVTADGLVSTVSSSQDVLSTSRDGTSAFLTIDHGSLWTNFDSGERITFNINGTRQMLIGLGGDISFYEDTGTTAKFFWDASAEVLTVDNRVKAGTTADGVSIGSAAGKGEVLGVDTAGNGWNPLDIRAGSATQLYLNTDGNVGIGTSSPDTELHIEDATGNAVVQIESSATGYSAVFFGDVNDGDVGQIRYDHSDNSMRFGTDATAEVMRITSTGNVGIGNGKQYYWGTGRAAIQGTSASDIMQFFTASLERLRITSTGNVGIGTTSPSSALQVAGTVTATAFSGPLTGAVTGNASTATTLQTARAIQVSGAVTGTANFDGSAAINIVTTATSDPTLTLAGDATGSATFTNLGNATLTVAVVDDSHNHSSSSGNFTVNGVLTTTANTVVQGSLQIDGDLTVSGNTVTVSATNLSLEDNMIYLNQGSVVSNPDLGWAGNYNDGTYAHAGFFRDASDGYFKPFKGYTLEPDASAFIDTAHASFALADIQAANFRGALVGNASTATTLQTARTIGMSGVTATATSFNGSANITIPVTAVPATLLTGTIADARISGSYTGMTNLTGTGTVDFAKFLGNAADSAAAPSFSWTGDTNTGMWQPAADQIGFSTGGTSRLILSTTALTSTLGVTAPTFTGALTGNASTATTLQTARTLTIGNTGKSFNGSANISWTLDELAAEYRIPTNSIRNNLGDPTVREMALFHGQYNNKFRFIAPTLQEESTDGTTWVTSTRASAAQLGDLMIGEGQGTGITAIPSATVGTYGGYRLTWSVVGTVGYVFLNNLYFYNSTSGNAVSALIEAYHNTNGWTTITGPHSFSNWPGHTSIPHSSVPYSNSAAQYSQIRVTFSTTHPTNTNAFTLNALEWFGGYPQGKRNVESYDRDKNVTFPANITGTSFIGPLTGNATTATTLETARTIGGVSFNGSANINLPGVNTAGNQSTSGNAASATILQTTRTINGVNFNGSANIVVEPYVEDAVATSVTRYITFVDNSTAGYKRLNEDSDLTYNPGTNTLTVPTVVAALTGNATTATTLQTARTINGVSFNGSANITVSATATNALTIGSYLTGTSYNGSSAVTIAVSAATANTVSTVVARDASGNFSAGTVTASLSGNATTATTLQTARTINGVSFNGSANITVADSTKLPLAGGTMTGDLIFGTADRDHSPIGTYDATKTQQIWSMGAAYKNSATGVDFGTLYGMSYKHTNNATGGTMAGGHQIVFVNNGIAGAAIGMAGGIWTSGTSEAATFNATSTTGGGFQGIDADSATVPSFTWTADQNTGIWHAAADQIGFTTAGVNRLTLSTTALTSTLGITAPTFTGALTGNATTATTLATTRAIQVSGAVTGTANFDGSAAINIVTTATSDPTLTLAGDATGSATFTNLGNATLTVAVVDDSHSHSFNNLINKTGGTGDYTTTGTFTGATFNATSTTNGGFQGIDADSITAPSFTWTGDLNTGMWNAAADQIGFTTGGTNQMTITTTGVTAVGTVTADTFNATSTTNGGFQGIDADSLTAPSFTWTSDLNTGMWLRAADQIGFTAGGNDEFFIATTYTQSLGSSRAPIFYDSNDTAYYVDPNSLPGNGSTSAGARLRDLRVDRIWQGVPAHSGPILTYTLTSGGTGYTNGTYTNQVLSGGQGVYATFDFTVAGGIVTVATLTERGSGFQATNTIAIPVLGGTGSGGLITVNTVRTVDVALYNSASRIRLASSDTSLDANQEIGGIYFNARDASAGGAGDKAYILGVAAGTSGGGEIQFWTSSNGGSPTLCATVGGANDFRLYNTAGTFYHSFSNNPTANQTLTLPDATGTIALTSSSITGSAASAGTATTLTGLTSTIAELNYSDGVTSNIQTQLNAKAALASPALTGTPTAPTAAVGTNTTQVATTAFVNAEIANDAPSKTGTGASGTWGISITGNAATATSATSAATATTLTGLTSTIAELNYTDGVTSAIQTQLNAKAPIASPTFTGTVTGPTFYSSGTGTGTGFRNNGTDSASFPGYTWNNDEDTGMYRVGANQIGFSCAGTNELTITTTTATFAGDIVSNSDIRLKKDIDKIDFALSKVKALNGVNFTKIKNGDRSTGLIAQDVKAVLPEAVVEDSEGMLSVAYGNMVGLLVEAIKEQDNKINTMRTEIEDLKTLVKQLMETR